ncbi:hypothetical protein MP228_003619 [Amoeboaphelidium protococcarum]|nr:hypothetical protein MP228_003619 [Amoeboaphelidium protococcarum]
MVDISLCIYLHCLFQLVNGLVSLAHLSLVVLLSPASPCETIRLLSCSGRSQVCYTSICMVPVQCLGKSFYLLRSSQVWVGLVDSSLMFPNAADVLVAGLQGFYSFVSFIRLSLRCSVFKITRLVLLSGRMMHELLTGMLKTSQCACGGLLKNIYERSLLNDGSRKSINYQFTLNTNGFKVITTWSPLLREIKKVVQHHLLLDSWLKFSHTGSLRPLVYVLVDGACAGSIALVCTKAAAEVMLAFLLNRSYQLG